MPVSVERKILATSDIPVLPRDNAIETRGFISASFVSTVNVIRSK